MAADNTSSGGRFSNFTKLINSSNGGGGESGDPWDDSPLLTRSAGDHVCRPVIIGSDGRVTPVTDFTALDALPPPHRPHHKEASPINAGSRAQFQIPASTLGSFHVGGHTYGEGGRGLNWGVGRADEPAKVLGRGGWAVAVEESEMGMRAANSFQAAAEFLWGTERTPGGSRSTPYALQQGEKSSAAPAIDSSDAAKKYGGKFVW